ncbi:MAG: response regulator transcription factor [Acidimicrobiales bacterium]
MARVLVIDDDRSLQRALRLGLEANGHVVTAAPDGQTGIVQAATVDPDAVIVDLGLPDLDGLEVCRRIREWSDVPIIILSATGAESTKIAALDGGASDYVTKPFSMGELDARLRAVLRDRGVTTTPTAPTTFALGELEVDLVHHDARVHGRRVDLTAKEFSVLAYLARHAGRTCTYQMILREVWGRGYGEEAAYVHTYVHRLRQKLDDEDGRLIQTLPGIGYSLTSTPR